MININAAANYCNTTAKYVAAWHDNDEHLINKVAVCLLFADRVSKTTPEDIQMTWDILTSQDADEPDMLNEMDPTVLHIIACYLSMLHEEVLHNSYNSWIDDVTEEHMNMAKELVNSRGGAA